MAFIPVTDGLEVVVQGDLTDGGHVINVFGYNTTDTLDQTLADHIGSTLHVCYDNIAAALSVSLTYLTCTVRDLREETGPEFEATTFGPITGTDTANLLPYQTAALISWKTNTRGRSFRGRTYLFGFCEDQSNGKFIATDLQDALAVFAEDLVGEGNFAVISRFSGVDPVTHRPIPRSEGIATKITSSSVHDTWRTQRRRATI